MKRYFWIGLLALAGHTVWPVAVEAQLTRREAASVLDTPDAHYQQGMKYLQAGDLKAALREFQEALRLDPNNPGTYLGFALLRTQEGDFDDARRYVREARRKDRKLPDVYLVEGRIRVQEGKKNWQRDAMKAYQEARKMNPQDDRAFFYEGEAYRKAGEYASAEAAYSRAIDMKGPTRELATRRLSQVQMAQKAAPGTAVGMRVMNMDPATRGDLCALLVEELKVEELVSKMGPKTYDTGFTPSGATAEADAGMPEDISGHWAKSWIARVLALELPGLQARADGRFSPDVPVTRKELAGVIQDVLTMITRDAGLRTRYVGSESRFPDVRPDVYYYNAAVLAVDRGLMSASKIDGTFRPDEEVSGSEAVLAIKDLRSALVGQ